MERFILEIYEPNSETTVLAHFETSSAMPIAAGETLHTGLFVLDRPNMALRVTRIENTFFQSAEGWVSKRMVYTQA
jgi:hypothetical protein